MVCLRQSRSARSQQGPRSRLAQRTSSVTLWPLDILVPRSARCACAAPGVCRVLSTRTLPPCPAGPCGPLPSWPPACGLSPETERVALACADDAGRHRNLLPTIVDIECTMVAHVLEAMLLYLITLPVDPWPLLRLQGVLYLRRAPIHPGLARHGLDDHRVPGIICVGLCPGPAIDPCAIRQGCHIGGFKAFQARMLVVIQPASKPKPCSSNALARATALTARSMTNTTLPVAQATR